MKLISTAVEYFFPEFFIYCRELLFCRPAQELLTENRYVSICIELLSDKALGQCRLLRLWLLIGLGRLWADYDDARWQAIRLAAYERVCRFSNFCINTVFFS